MTQWYYSDAHRNRLGPVSAEEMAALHRGGQLRPDTLVWRQDLSDWVQWRTIQTEVVPPGGAGPGAPRLDPVVATDLRAPVEPLSPYAPPAAALDVETVVMPEGEVVYAGLWKRFAATLIDSLLMAVVLIPLGLALGWGEEDSRFFSLSTLVIVAAYSLYMGVMQARPAAATLGKMAVSIKVVRTDGTPMTLPRAIARTALLQTIGQVPRGILIVLMGLMIPFSPRKQSLHDLLLDTVVVDKYAFTRDADRQNPKLDGVTLTVLTLFVLGVLLAFVLALLGLGSIFTATGGGG